MKVLSERNLNVSVHGNTAFDGQAVQAKLLETEMGWKVDALERYGSPLRFRRAFPHNPASAAFQRVYRTFQPTMDDAADFIADLISEGTIIPGVVHATGHAWKQYQFIYE